MLVAGGRVVINVVYMRAHLLKLAVAYLKPQLLFALGKRDPKPPPCRKLIVIGEKALHILPGVASAQGVFVKFVLTHLSP